MSGSREWVNVKLNELGSMFMYCKHTRNMIVNFDERKFYKNRYLITNEFGNIAIVYADGVNDALDIAVDNGKLDREAMSEEDYAEYEANNWTDSFILLGNASEPFWCENLSINVLYTDRELVTSTLHT